MANRKAEPSRCYIARAWYIYSRKNGGSLQRAPFERWIAPLYTLQLSSRQAAALVWMTFDASMRRAALRPAMRADRTRPVMQ